MFSLLSPLSKEGQRTFRVRSYVIPHQPKSPLGEDLGVQIFFMFSCCLGRGGDGVELRRPHLSGDP